MLDVAGMRVLDVTGTDATPYPLSLVAIPTRTDTGDGLRLTLKYMSDEVDDAGAAVVLDRFAGLLADIAADPQRRVANVTAADATSVLRGADRCRARRCRRSSPTPRPRAPTGSRCPAAKPR